MRRFILVLLMLATITVSGAAVIGWIQNRGVYVTVVNSGPDPMLNVEVHVTGNTHPIGTLAAGQSKTVRVLPTSESGVELTFTDHLGLRQRLNAGGYIENGYVGTIGVEIEHGAIKQNEHHIKSSLF